MCASCLPVSSVQGGYREPGHAGLMVKCALPEEIKNRDKSVFCMSVADLQGCRQNSLALTFLLRMSGLQRNLDRAINGNGCHAVLRRALDHPVRVCQVNQCVASGIDHAHNAYLFENQRNPLAENFF